MKGYHIANVLQGDPICSVLPAVATSNMDSIKAPVSVVNLFSYFKYHHYILCHGRTKNT